MLKTILLHTFIYTVLIATCTACDPKPQEKSTSDTQHSIDSLVALPTIPSGYSLVDSTRGDLNKDGQPELVWVLQTPDTASCFIENDDSSCHTRELRIYEYKGSAWTLLLQKPNFVWPSGQYMYSKGFVGMYIDATHRLVTEHNIYTGSRLEDFDYVYTYSLQGKQLLLEHIHVQLGWKQYGNDSVPSYYINNVYDLDIPSKTLKAKRYNDYTGEVYKDTLKTLQVLDAQLIDGAKQAFMDSLVTAEGFDF